MLQMLVHYGMHFVMPMLIAYRINRIQWFKLYLILLLTMVMDLDHFLADPIFDPNRCSIGFHPLHSYLAICIYIVSLRVFWRRLYVRTFIIGLLFHIFTDAVDCLWRDCSGIACFQ
jgi:hypothetical protein